MFLDFKRLCSRVRSSLRASRLQQHIHIDSGLAERHHFSINMAASEELRGHFCTYFLHVSPCFPPFRAGFERQRLDSDFVELSRTISKSSQPSVNAARQCSGFVQLRKRFVELDFSLVMRRLSLIFHGSSLILAGLSLCLRTTRPYGTC